MRVGNVASAPSASPPKAWVFVSVQPSKCRNSCVRSPAPPNYAFSPTPAISRTVSLSRNRRTRPLWLAANPVCTCSHSDYVPTRTRSKAPALFRLHWTGNTVFGGRKDVFGRRKGLFGRAFEEPYLFGIDLFLVLDGVQARTTTAERRPVFSNANVVLRVGMDPSVG